MHKLSAVFVLFLAFQASAQDRLLIEVLPFYVEVEVYDHSSDAGQADWDYAVPGPDALAKAMAAVHEAMALLGVDASKYDLRVSNLGAETLHCTLSPASNPALRCADRTGFEVRSQMMVDLGYSRKSSGNQGSVILGVLLFPDHPSFEWVGYILHGTNKWWSWSGFHPGSLHWSTTSCAVWSVPWVHTIAHELGHCFGLHHPNTNTDEKNRSHFGDYDNRLDLMVDTEQGGNLSVDWLKPYNAARIRDHFSDEILLSAPLESSEGQPGLEAVTPD